MLSRRLADEATVEIVDEVRRTPVELRRDSGHVCCGESRHHEAAPRSWQKIDEGLDVRGLVIALTIHHYAVRVQNDGREAGDDPGPRANGVVGDLEKEGRQ